MIVSLLSILVSTEILFISISSEDTFDCTGYEDDSYHPMYNINNCRHYWQCIYVDTVYMRAVKRVCPAGTEFDDRLKQCEISSLVNCIPIQSPSTSTSTENQRTLIDVAVMTTSKSQQLQVLPTIPTLSFEQLLENLIAMKRKSAAYIIESEVKETTHSQSTVIQTTTRIKRRRRRRRRNHLTINIFISNEHKIRQFSINQTHGLLIYCNEIRRHQLRDFILRTTTKSFKIANSSSKVFSKDLLSLTIGFLLFLQK